MEQCYAWLEYRINKGLRTRVVIPQILNLPQALPPNLRILLKSVSGAAEKSKILVICSHILLLLFVQFMQFPILNFGLAHYGSEPFK